MYQISTKKATKIVIGYIRKKFVGYIPNVIIQQILKFYHKLFVFNVYSHRRYNIFDGKCINFVFNYKSLFFVDNANVLYIKGLNNCGQLGDPAFTTKDVDLKENGFFKGKNITFISHGLTNVHSFIYTDERVLYGFGKNYSGQTGFNASNEKLRVPCKVMFDFGSALYQIECGNHHTLLLSYKGNVFGCGSNDYGQLSDQYKYFRKNENTSIQLLRKKDDITRIGCCYYSSYILTDKHTLYSFGLNNNGSLGGNFTDVSSSQLIQVISFYDDSDGLVSSFECGSDHIGCLTMNNKIHMFGDNSSYQCGYTNEIPNNNNILNLPNIGSIVSIKCGENHNIIKSCENKYYSFGDNTNNQLILNTNDNEYKPQLISDDMISKCLNKSSYNIIDIIPASQESFIICEF